MSEENAQVPTQERIGPLELASFDDLYAELCRRFDGVVLVTSKDVTQTEVQTKIRHHGSFHEGIALCWRAATWIERKILENVRDDPEHI